MRADQGVFRRNQLAESESTSLPFFLAYNTLSRDVILSIKLSNSDSENCNQLDVNIYYFSDLEQSSA